MNTEKKEIDLLTLQLWTTVIYLVSLSISIALTYDEIQRLKKQPTLFTTKQNNQISIFNRTFVLILTLSYLYISYQNVHIAKQKNQASWPFDLQLLSSELSTISAIIVLYVVLKTSGEQYSIVAGIGNPNL